MAGGNQPGPLREWGGEPPWGGALIPLDRPSLRPDFDAPGGFEPETNALWGVRLPWNQPGQPFFADAGELLDSLLARFERLADLDELERIVERILGPQSFSLGVVYGAGETFVVSVADMLGLFKTFVLADLHDATRRNPAWTMWQPGGIARYLTAHMLEEYFGDALMQAAGERDALLAELKAIFESPGEFLGRLGEQYGEKFRRFVALSADPSLASQFQAGRILGELLLDALALIGAGAAVAKGLSRIPRLARLARGLKGKFSRRIGAAGGAAESGGGPPLPPARSSSSSSARAGAREPKAAAVDEGPTVAVGDSAVSKVNEVKWTHDESGRLVKAEGTLRQSHVGAERSAAEAAAQKQVGKSGLAGDEGGHAVGHRFVLDQGKQNMFPQNSKFNKSAYKSMENEWADWIKAGAEVKFKIEFEGIGVRPDEVFVRYEVVNPSTGKVIHVDDVSFANEAGQTFDRMSSREIAAMMR